MKNVGVIGGGLIGASWAAIFSKSGFNVLVHDSHPEVFESFKSRVQLFLEELKSIDDSINVEESLKRIKINQDIFVYSYHLAWFLIKLEMIAPIK